MGSHGRQLPESWAEATIGAIAELVGGGTPRRSQTEFFGGDIVWLTPTEIPKTGVSVVKSSEETLTELGLRSSSARLVPEGTVLLTSRASIGYVAIAGSELSTNQGFALLLPKPGIYNYYLAYWLKANVDLLEQNATGTTFKEISKGRLRPLRIPIPPENEQKRIVAEIETQFTRLDDAVADLRRLQHNLDRYRASVLKAAFEGRLVPQDPADEPAGQLLQRILAERRRRWEEQEWQKHVGRAQKKVAQARRKAAGRPARLGDLEPEEWQDVPEEEYRGICRRGRSGRRRTRNRLYRS
jgi:type I restriction enzyme, S subunit